MVRVSPGETADSPVSADPLYAARIPPDDYSRHGAARADARHACYETLDCSAAVDFVTDRGRARKSADLRAARSLKTLESILFYRWTRERSSTAREPCREKTVPLSVPGRTWKPAESKIG